MQRFIAGSLFSLLFFCQSLYAVDPGLDWKTVESEHLFVHYADGYKDIAERVVSITEEAHQRLTKELNWAPAEKTHVILSDETDLPNGFATPLYFNRTVLYLAPPTSINTLEDFDDWLSTLIVHEYTHIVHLDKSAGSPGYLRKIFGRFLFLFPNLFQPAWILEGVATDKETDLHRGIGRGQSTMYAAMMREEVAKGVQPISHVNLPVKTWPAGTTRYLYGVYFMRFMEEKYGEEKLQLWIEEYSNNLLPFFINTNANKTFDKKLAPLWQEYIDWLEERFQPQIDYIKENGIKAGTQLSTDAYRTDSVRAISTKNGDEVYYVRNSGYKRASLVHINSEGTTEDLLDLNNGADLDLHADAGLLLTQNEYCNNYTIYKDIYVYHEDNKKLKRLTKCGRYIFASWHPDGKQIIAVQHDATRFELHLLNKQAQQKEVLWRASKGEIIGQVDVSPDGKKVVASVWRPGKGWNMELFDLSARKWKKITSGTSITANPQFDPEGNILFSLEAEGVYNLYRYYLKSGKIKQLTNLIGGAFQSSQASKDGPIYYAGYSAEGYAIYTIDDSASAKSPALSDDRLHMMDYKISSHQQTDYSAWSNMYPRWWFPTWELSDQRSELGLTTTGGDALGIHNYSLSASYDFKLDAPAGQINYAYADRLFLSAVRENEITLNADGSLNRISNRDIASAVLAFPKRYIQKSSDLLFSVIYDKTSDAELAAGAIPYDDFEDDLLGAAWLHDTTYRAPLSISLNDGMVLRLVAEDSDILSSDFTGQVYTFDWRQYIRTGKESVFTFRLMQGWGTEQPRSFKLGGDGGGDNVASILLGFNKQAVFNKRSYALRGYQEGLPQLTGRRAQLLSGEWRFPFQRLEQGIMAPPVGIMQWFGTVFAETGSAYQDSPDTYYSSAGFELIADINIFYYVGLRARLGYAHGFDEDIGDDQVYLVMGNSF